MEVQQLSRAFWESSHFEGVEKDKDIRFYSSKFKFKKQYSQKRFSDCVIQLVVLPVWTKPLQINSDVLKMTNTFFNEIFTGSI